MNQPHARAETFSQVWAMEFSIADSKANGTQLDLQEQ